MTKVIKVMTIGSLLAASALYGASTAACVGCHGKNFEKKALGKSKIVKDMSKEDIVKALKGYKNGSYGGAMKGLMKGQVASLSQADMNAIAESIKGGAKAPTKAEAKSAPKVIDINAKVADKARLAKEDLGTKKVIDETDLGLRKSGLKGATNMPIVTYNRPAPGSAPKFERSYVNAPPLIPHSIKGLVPITTKSNQCLGCHMPNVAKGVGATPIPESHFTDFRPSTKLDKKGDVVKDGKVISNATDITIAKFKKLKKLNPARFNCTQCHVPQANVKPLVGNTFKPDFINKKQMEHSNLLKVIDEGVK